MSTEPIKKVFEGILDYGSQTRFTKGVSNTAKELFFNKDNQDGLWKTIKKAHLKDGSDEAYDLVKIAGSAFTASAAGRVISGGGLYKDKNGNTNIIGIPFI